MTVNTLAGSLIQTFGDNATGLLAQSVGGGGGSGGFSVAAGGSSTIAAFCWVIRSMSPTAALMLAMPLACSCAERAMEAI